MRCHWLPVTSELKWTNHITNICGKANGTIGFMKRNLNIGNKNIKEKAYKSLVRPTLQYACTAWDPHLAADIRKLEMVRRRSARFRWPRGLRLLAEKPRVAGLIPTGAGYNGTP